MKRDEFITRAACGLAALAAVTPAAAQETKTPPAPRPPRKYAIAIEIYEARPDSWCHKKGDTFSYPQDWGKICPWLRASLHDFIILLEKGVTLPWKYENTPYEKVIDPDGLTTEYVRCPDPTSNLVAKITRTALPAEGKKQG